MNNKKELIKNILINLESAQKQIDEAFKAIKELSQEDEEIKQVEEVKTDEERQNEYWQKLQEYNKAYIRPWQKKLNKFADELDKAGNEAWNYIGCFYERKLAEKYCTCVYEGGIFDYADHFRNSATRALNCEFEDVVHMIDKKNFEGVEKKLEAFKNGNVLDEYYIRIELKEYGKMLKALKEEVQKEKEKLAKEGKEIKYHDWHGDHKKSKKLRASWG